VKLLRQKLVLLLADPSIPRSDLATFYRWLENGGISACIAQAEEIRTILSEPLPTSTGDKSVEVPPVTVHAELIETITRLLIDEAHLRRRPALEELAHRLDYRERLPDRISFDKGIARLIASAGGSRVLSAAQQIRNAVVHHADSLAWPLREGTDDAARESNQESS
jgi:hypothetical protein